MAWTSASIVLGVHSVPSSVLSLSDILLKRLLLQNILIIYTKVLLNFIEKDGHG